MNRGLPVLEEARGLDPWRSPKGSRAVATRMKVAIQHVAKTVAKHMQHAAPNNVALCCVEMLRAFGQLLHNISQRDPTICDLLR